jgi:hypothetical protein
MHGRFANREIALRRGWVWRRLRRSCDGRGDRRQRAHPDVDAAGNHTRGQRAVEQQVVDAQTGVTRPVLAEVIPKGVDALVRISDADDVGR